MSESNQTETSAAAQAVAKELGAINWGNLIAAFQTLLPAILQLVALFNPPKPPTPPAPLAP